MIGEVGRLRKCRFDNNIIKKVFIFTLIQMVNMSKEMLLSKISSYRFLISKINKTKLSCIAFSLTLISRGAEWASTIILEYLKNKELK
ncbi:hypothetical protein D0T60_15125 [Bacteroides sp. 224]|nr:hypothetical protein [Bacteroides sp. 224]